MRKSFTVLQGGACEQPAPEKVAPRRRSLSEMEILSEQIDQSFQWFWEGKKRGILWIFDKESGLWRNDGLMKFHNIYGTAYAAMACDEKGNKKYYPKALSEIESYFLSLQTDQAQELPQPPVHLIPFQNGVFDLKTGCLIPYSHEQYFTAKLPWNFNEKASSEWFLKLFSEWVNEPEEIIEILALCLYRDMPIQKFFFLLGSGANGKTMLLQILTRALGEVNVSTLPLDEFRDRFAAIELHRKLANIVDELPPDTIRDSGMLKRLTGNSQLTSDVKHRDRVTFTSYATQIVAMNTLPPTDDTTEAFYRRIHILDFPNKIPIEKRDLDLSRKLANETENYEGIIALAIRKLQHAMNNDWKFQHVIERDTDAVRVEYSTRSDTVTFMIDEFCQDSEGERVPCSTMVTNVNRIRKIQGLSPVTPMFVNRRMQAAGYDRERVRVNGDYQFCWMEIRLDLERLAQWYQANEPEHESLEPTREILDVIDSATRPEKSVMRAIYAGYTVPSKIAAIANVDEEMMRGIIRDLLAVNIISGNQSGVLPVQDRARRTMIEKALKEV